MLSDNIMLSDNMLSDNIILSVSVKLTNNMLSDKIADNTWCYLITSFHLTTSCYLIT
jgi:hypothetical protein